MRESGHLFWEFTKEFSLRVEAPSCLGVLSQEDALSRGALLVQGGSGSLEEGNKILFSWLIDTNGIVLDALFSAFGDTVLIGCAEIVCEKSIGKHYSKARSLEKTLLESMFTAKIPGRVLRLISLVLQARDQVCGNSCLPSSQKSEKNLNLQWDSLSKDERLVLIRAVIEEYIQPHLRRDGGGIEVIDLIDGYKVSVVFQGSCVDCFASSGSTFSYIQHVLKHQVHESLEILKIA